MIPPPEALTLLLSTELDLSGPRPFADLFSLAQAAAPFASPPLLPATLHDHLNNLLASGSLLLSHAGLYYLPLTHG